MQLCEQHVQTLSAQHAQQPWGASTLGVHIGTDPQVFETCDTKHITPGCCLGCTGNLGLPFFIIIATLAFFFFFFFANIASSTHLNHWCAPAHMMMKLPSKQLMAAVTASRHSIAVSTMARLVILLIT